MYGRRRSYRKIPRGPRTKYSLENFYFLGSTSNIQTDPAIVSNSNDYQSVQTIIPATTVEGMRKVKNLTITVEVATADKTARYAIVYVPYATNVNYLCLLAYPNKLYEPSQFVMAQGMIDQDMGPNRIRSSVSRNLNEGDQIVFLIATDDTTSFKIAGQYSVAYN